MDNKTNDTLVKNLRRKVREWDTYRDFSKHLPISEPKSPCLCEPKAEEIQGGPKFSILMTKGSVQAGKMKSELPASWMLSKSRAKLRPCPDSQTQILMKTVRCKEARAPNPEQDTKSQWLNF